MEQSIVWAVGSANTEGSGDDGQVISGPGDSKNSGAGAGSAGGAANGSNRECSIP